MGVEEFYTDMEDWRGDYQTSLMSCALSLFEAHTSLGNVSFPLTSVGECSCAIAAIKGACSELIDAVNEAIGRGSGRYSSTLTMDGILLAGLYPETEITAAKIIEAWVMTTRTERLMTVLTLDELRRDSWEQRFIDYRIAPALEG